MDAICVRRLAAADVCAAADLLAVCFLDDQGMVKLFKDQHPERLHRSMRSWFLATLDMWLKQKRAMFAAFDGTNLVGVLLAGHSRYKVNGTEQLKWAWRVGVACGLTPVVRTAQHDAERQEQFKPHAAQIVEFVGVSPIARGKGVGRLLFETFHRQVGESEIVWLETTRHENLSIFSKLGYLESSRSTSLGTDFIQMTKLPT